MSSRLPKSRLLLLDSLTPETLAAYLLRCMDAVTS